jgi:hypothetical protein
LAQDQKKAAASIIPTKGNVIPAREPPPATIASPVAATAMPATLVIRILSFKKTAASNAVKNAWDCRITELSPAGAPSFSAVKRNPNWPTPSSRP